MDINFILFFVFLLLVILILEETEDGLMMIIYGLFFVAIFANTQSASPVFFADSDLLGWGQLFNIFWLVLAIICFVKSYVTAKDKGLFRRL